ncbi:hypothetical protein COS31_04960 [Candidatus Roizmanbacteria bacterium CG02_land_8_20_14_3_00_36_15]|nr:MAG: hypothetical protein COS31_04960 [Candidatus Roizmanbacteria bacterium CG02_land_8_20_14_3_00_36_15]
MKSSNPKGSLLRAGGKGVWGEFRPPYKFWAKSVRIFSNAHRQLGKVGEFSKIRPSFSGWQCFLDEVRTFFEQNSQ